MSSTPDLDERSPLIVLIDRANRAMQQHMVETGSQRGAIQGAKMSWNAVFGRLGFEGARASELAARAGITRQSMGEVIREMVDVGLLEMQPDPSDKRAKLVTYTEFGMEQARLGFHHILGLEQRFAEEFGEKEYAITRDVLERLVPLLERIEAEQE